MRNAFAAELTDIAGEDKRVILLAGDIGNRLFDNFKTRYPERFLNCGVAEANMTSMAAGMARCGLRPVTYTIASFNTTRCLEQIRVDLCYHNFPVVVVGVGAGLSYASLNATHHCCEDIAFLRAIPNMTVICPGDPWEVRSALRTALAHNGPVYIRLGKKGEPAVHDKAPQFTIGKSIVLRDGTDVCLLGTGVLLPTALETADLLERQGVSTRVVSFHTVKPLDEAMLAEAFTRFHVVATVEEHSVLGGLGGSVAEWLADRPPQRARLLRIGTVDSFMYESGDTQFAREFFDLTAKSIAQRVRRLLCQNRPGTPQKVAE